MNERSDRAVDSAENENSMHRHRQRRACPNDFLNYYVVITSDAFWSLRVGCRPFRVCTFHGRTDTASSSIQQFVWGGDFQFHLNRKFANEKLGEACALLCRMWPHFDETSTLTLMRDWLRENGINDSNRIDRDPNTKMSCRRMKQKKEKTKIINIDISWFSTCVFAIESSKSQAKHTNTHKRTCARSFLSVRSNPLNTSHGIRRRYRGEDECAMNEHWTAIVSNGNRIFICH